MLTILLATYFPKNFGQYQNFHCSGCDELLTDTNNNFCSSFGMWNNCDISPNIRKTVLYQKLFKCY